MFQACRWQKQTQCIKTNASRCSFSQPVQCFLLSGSCGGIAASSGQDMELHFHIIIWGAIHYVTVWWQHRYKRGWYRRLVKTQRIRVRKKLNWLAKTTAWNISFNASCLFLPPTCLKHLYFSVGTLRFWKGCCDRVRNVGDCGTSQPATNFRT